MELYETETGQQREIAMSDGSHILLGARSSITTEWSEKRRTVVLQRGEALFQVARDNRRPFMVWAGSGCIQAIGTSFNVLRQADRVVVTVSEGAVVVAPRERATAKSRAEPASSDNPSTWLPASLKSGQVMSYQEDGTATAVAHADPRIATAWSSGRLQYLREPLRRVIADVNRYWNKQITFDKTAGDLLYTGDVMQTEIEDWTRHLPEIFPVSVSEADSSSVVIRIRPDAETQN